MSAFVVVCEENGIYVARQTGTKSYGEVEVLADGFDSVAKAQEYIELVND